MKLNQIILTAFLAFLSAVGIHADSVRDQHVEVELVSETASIQPGRSFTVALRISHDPHWHTYWINPGDAGLSTTLQWDLPEGFAAGLIQWPAPIIFKLTGLTNYGYEDEVFLLVEITPPETLPEGKNVTLRAETTYLMCDDVCIPGKASLFLSLPVANETPQGDEKWQPAIVQTRENLPRQFNNWEVAAYREGDKMTLALAPPDGIDANLEDVYFYSSDAQVDPNAGQELKRSENGYLLELVRSAYAKETGSLPGVLKAESAWGGDGSVKAVFVDAPLLDGPIPPEKGENGKQNKKAAASAGGFAYLLVMALAGGFILNLMPCVFPVLGLKVMNFVCQAGEKKGKVALHGLLFTSGVLLSFWVLAGILSLLRSGGAELGWGFQLQSPVFVFLLTLLLFVFALNLSGLFEVGTSLAGTCGGLASRGGKAGSFFSGVLATAVATPCAAPFLAPALGAALAIETGRAFLLFTAIGLGLSIPYLILSIFPSLVKILPRPGPWMESFRQLMAFPLFATVGYLLWVLAGQLDEFGLLSAIFALVAIAMAAWIYGRWTDPGKKPKVRFLGRIGATVFLIFGIYFGFPVTAPSSLLWEEWSPEKVKQLRAEGHPVYVDFTARWCATCQANKKLVFSSKKVLEVFKKKKIVTLKADWTNQDSRITKALAGFNRSAVPFNILYIPGNENPVILPEILTPGIVLKTLDKI